MKEVTFAICCVLLCFGRTAGESTKSTVIYDEKPTQVDGLEQGTKDLWITTTDLTRATKFIHKPEGVCDDKHCFPIPQGRTKEFVKEDDGKTWFNLSEFARLLKQPSAHSQKHRTWYFGPRPEVQNAYLAAQEAADFTLPDLQGELHSLKDFRGKKVLLLTWGSW